jgi:hypothetical protein
MPHEDDEPNHRKNISGATTGARRWRDPRTSSAEEILGDAEAAGLEWVRELPLDVRMVVVEELRNIEHESRQGAGPQRAPIPSEPRAPKPVPRIEPEPVRVRQRTTGFDIQQWLADQSERDPIKGVALRIALDDWNHGSGDARKTAVEVLASVAPAESLFVELLVGADASQTEDALRGLALLGSERLFSCLRTTAQSPEPEVRIAALRAVQRMDSDEAIKILARAAKDPSPRVRRRVVNWLCWRNDAWVQDLVWDMCHDDDPTVRWAALRVMLQRNATDVIWRVERAKESESARYRFAKALLDRTRREPEPREQAQREPPAVTAEQAKAFVALANGRKPKRTNTTHQTEVDDVVDGSDASNSVRTSEARASRRGNNEAVSSSAGSEDRQDATTRKGQGST